MNKYFSEFKKIKANLHRESFEFLSKIITVYKTRIFFRNFQRSLIIQKRLRAINSKELKPLIRYKESFRKLGRTKTEPNSPLLKITKPDPCYHHINYLITLF